MVKFEEQLMKALNKISIKEDQYKMPTSAHRLRQAAYRQSFGPSPSFGGVTYRKLDGGKKDAK